MLLYCSKWTLRTNFMISYSSSRKNRMIKCNVCLTPFSSLLSAQHPLTQSMASNSSIRTFLLIMRRAVKQRKHNQIAWQTKEGHSTQLVKMERDARGRGYESKVQTEALSCDLYFSKLFNLLEPPLPRLWKCTGIHILPGHCEGETG